ncbi:MAG: prepilin-type N-terminal cleavage/methylation domain-containing protein [Acidobacteriia bacterium]|nr:prepilin-type N-terminal cleavage/methylation domain-containing protein [Terriglobia bacterium]
MTERRDKESGFSLIEITIAAAIIVLLVAIMVPRMFSARIRANEASAEVSIHAITAAESIFNSAYPQAGYANSLDKLGSHGGNCDTVNASNACLIDSKLSSGMKDGYLFEVIGDGNTPDASYKVTGVPEAIGGSGNCSFASDQSGSLHITTAHASSGGSRSAGLSGNGCSLVSN